MLGSTWRLNKSVWPCKCNYNRRYAYALRLISTTPALSIGKLKPLSHLPARTIPKYQPIPNIHDLYSMTWETRPRNIFFVKKPWNSYVRQALVDLIDHVTKTYENINIMVEHDVAEEIAAEVDCDLYGVVPGDAMLYDTADLLVTLGGDGTILNATSIFSNGPVPPVLSFSMGTLGFLLPFDIKDASKAFEKVCQSEAMVLNRFRLQCETHQTITQQQLSISSTYAMNDISIHRGPDPHLTMLEIEVDGLRVTQAIADGVIVSTPTGSTAYSLSSGGSIVHPSVSCILITPICPRSLSFRPLIFPASSTISISMAKESRGRSTLLSIDGIKQANVFKGGDKIIVQQEKGIGKGIWCVANSSEDWVHNINGLLGFNSTFGLRSRH